MVTADVVDYINKQRASESKTFKLSRRRRYMDESYNIYAPCDKSIHDYY